MATRDVLIGWQKIARHLDVDERTARRWAALDVDPLPIGNCAHDRVRVAAYVDALNEWRERQGTHATRRKARQVVRPAAA